MRLLIPTISLVLGERAESDGPRVYPLSAIYSAILSGGTLPRARASFVMLMESASILLWFSAFLSAFISSLSCSVYRLPAPLCSDDLGRPISKLTSKSSGTSTSAPSMSSILVCGLLIFKLDLDPFLPGPPELLSLVFSSLCKL